MCLVFTSYEQAKQAREIGLETSNIEAAEEDDREAAYNTQQRKRYPPKRLVSETEDTAGNSLVCVQQTVYTHSVCRLNRKNILVFIGFLSHIYSQDPNTRSMSMY